MYIPSKDNRRANALSWRYDIAREKTIVNNAILKKNNNRSLSLAKKINNLIRITNEILEELHEVIIL